MSRKSIKGYEVLVDEVTVLQTIARLQQADGSVFYQNGLGRTYLLGEVVPPDKVADDWKEALEAGEGSLYDAISRRLKAVSDEPVEDTAQRLSLPFDGYDDMDEDDLVRAMSVLPSATIQRIKEYESGREEPRERIVNYNIGYGESPDDRQFGKGGSEAAPPDEGKAAGQIATRNVPDEGPVTHGEGVTGTGEPAVPPGTAAAVEAGEQPPRATGTLKGAVKKAAEGNKSGGNRSSRRSRSS